MNLTLEITQPQSPTAGNATRHVFSREGGTIGRAASSDWILSHRKVSGRHASITFLDNVFYIVDENSANGVFINSTKNRLIPGKRYALKPGDQIIIDPYEISVSISAEHGSELRRPFDDAPDVGFRHQRGGVNPFDSVDPFAPEVSRTPRPQPPLPSVSPTPPPPGEVVPLEELDPLKLLGGATKPIPSERVPTAKDLEAGSLLSGHYRPPAIPSQSVAAPAAPLDPFQIPADYDPLSADEPEEPPAPAVSHSPPVESPPVRATPAPLTAPSSEPATPRATPPPETPPPETGSAAPVPIATPRAPAVAGERGLVAVLEGAGLERAPVTEEFARNFGEIFRVVVSGVMDVLRARQQIKDEFRMRLTQFRSADNNPLKFSANVDDALHNLLVKRNPAYLEPVEAFEDAFDDLRDHQIAMLAGMRVAFESMLGQFRPEQLQQHFDRHLKRSALSSMTARLHYWDLYRERFEELAKDPEVTFKQLFGEEFAKAYDEQLRRLKADRRAAHPQPRSTDA